jgi:hypothetical protein
LFIIAGICKLVEKSSTMNNLLKLFTLVGTGLILGSMASQIIQRDRLRINRILGIGDHETREMDNEKSETIPGHHEELENCFI